MGEGKKGKINFDQGGVALILSSNLVPDGHCRDTSDERSSVVGSYHSPIVGRAICPKDGDERIKGKRDESTNSEPSAIRAVDVSIYR